MRFSDPPDVVVVRELGLPFQPEIAAGAIGEGGVRVLDRRVRRLPGVTAARLSVVDAVSRRPLSAGAAIVGNMSKVDFRRELSFARVEFATPVCAELASLRCELDRSRDVLAGGARCPVR